MPCIEGLCKIFYKKDGLNSHIFVQFYLRLMMHHGIIDSMDMNLNKFREIVKDR